MKLPPFDERPGRERLRKLLNELDGVHVHYRQVNGWPRFPIERLEDPANLLKLVAVLDRIAEESHTVTPPQADQHGGRGQCRADNRRRGSIGARGLTPCATIRLWSGVLRDGDWRTTRPDPQVQDSTNHRTWPTRWR